LSGFHDIVVTPQTVGMVDYSDKQSSPQPAERSTALAYIIGLLRSSSDVSVLAALVAAIDQAEGAYELPKWLLDAREYAEDKIEERGGLPF